MRFVDYLRERFYQILLFSVILLTIESFLLTIPNSGFMKWYIPLTLSLGYIFVSWFEFKKKKKLLDTMDSLITQLDKKYLLPELLHYPDRKEDIFLLDIMHEMKKSMIENVNKYKLENKEYKEYIEMWIHEVKIPIAAGKMIAENNKSEAMNHILSELGKIESYVEQALYYARSNTVEKDYIIKAIPLEELVNQVIIHNKKELIEKKTKIKLEGLNQSVYSDSKWLNFILNQIIVNSIKYTEKIPMDLTICGEEKKEEVVLKIKDNGIGIREGDLYRVFEKGFTGEHGRQYSKSTGIGLYLCKKLCNKLSHGLYIESKEGEGTCVTITFPKGSLLFM